MPRPRFESENDFLCWVLAKVGQVLAGLSKFPDEEVGAEDVPILEAYRARRSLEILGEQLVRRCPNPAHEVEAADPGEVAEAVREATARAALEIPIQYRKEQ